MPKRKRPPPAQHAPNLNGDLGAMLKDHAEQRMVYYFAFMIFYCVTYDYVKEENAKGNLPVLHTNTYNQGISKAATVQIQKGQRAKSYQTVYKPFDKKNPNVVTLLSTKFRDIDASHRCNLGIMAQASAVFDQIVNAGTDQTAKDMIEHVETFAGDTIQLPQAVNIGPDRIVDTFHGDFIGINSVLQPQVLSTNEVTNYKTIAFDRVDKYKTRVAASSEMGLAACAQKYLDAYNDADIVTRVFRRVSDLTRADIVAWGRDPSLYIGV